MEDLSLKNEIMKNFKNSELILLCDIIWYLPSRHNFEVIDNKLVVYDSDWDYKTAKFEDLLNCKTFKWHLSLYFIRKFNEEKVPLHIFIQREYLKLKDKYELTQIIAKIYILCITEYWKEINEKFIFKIIQSHIWFNKFITKK